MHDQQARTGNSGRGDRTESRFITALDKVTEKASIVLAEHGIKVKNGKIRQTFNAHPALQGSERDIQENLINIGRMHGVVDDRSAFVRGAGEVFNATLNVLIREINASEISSTQGKNPQIQRHTFSLPSLFPKTNSNSTLDKAYAVGRGIEKARDNVVDATLHPIETLQDMMVTIWDGYNAISDITFGVSSEGSKIRNAMRGESIVTSYNNFIQANSTLKLEMLAGLASTTILGAGIGSTTRGITANGMGAMRLAVKTRYGHAFQGMSVAEIQARLALTKGSYTIYKAGKSAKSELQGQYWALERPNDPTYAARYGIPPRNTPFDFIQQGQLKENARMITRKAPPFGPNQGGSIEVVTEIGDVNLKRYETITDSAIINQYKGHRSKFKAGIDAIVKSVFSEPALGSLIAVEQQIFKADR